MENRNILINAEKMIAFVAIILLAVLLRLLPHPPNMAPLAGLALFSGYYLHKKFAFLIALLALFISDLFLGFHTTMPYVYGSFFLIALLGRRMQDVNALSLLKTSLVSSVLFFLITNFGVWQANTMYEKNISGLMQSYTMGLPFFRNTIVGDVLYTFVFFYGFAFVYSCTKKVGDSLRLKMLHESTRM